MATQAQTGTPSKVIADVPIDQFCEEFLDLYPAKSKSSYRNGRRALEIAIGLGVKTTADLTPELLDQFESALELRKIPPRMGFRLFNALRTACNFAVRRVALKCSPFPARPLLVLRLSRASRAMIRRKPTPNPVQLKAWFKHLRASAGNDLLCHRSDVLRALVAYAGLTLSEATSVRVADVDFEAKVIRYTDGKGTSHSVMMTEELAHILRDWLRRPLRREVPVIKMRRLWKKGCHSIRELSKQFDMAYTAARSIVLGLTWRHITEDTKAPVRISDQQWLLPNLRAGEEGPWRGAWTRDKEDRMTRVSDACKAAGTGDINLKDLLRFNIIYVEPSPMPYVPRELPACRADTPCPVAFHGRSSRRVIINNDLKGPLSREAFSVLRVLVKAWPEGVSKFELERRSGRFTTAVKLLKGMKRLDKDFDAVIELPGKGYGDGYRLVSMNASIDK